MSFCNGFCVIISQWSLIASCASIITLKSNLLKNFNRLKKNTELIHLLMKWIKRWFAWSLYVLEVMCWPASGPWETGPRASYFTEDATIGLREDILYTLLDYFDWLINNLTVRIWLLSPTEFVGWNHIRLKSNCF